MVLISTSYHRIIQLVLTLTVFQNRVFRGRSVRFGGNRLASLERASRYQHEPPENLKPELSLVACCVPFLFRRISFSLSISLSFSLLSSSMPLFLAIPPFPLFTMVCPFLHSLVRSSFVTLPSPGNARPLCLSLSLPSLLAPSLPPFLSRSFHLCFTRSRVLLTRTRFSSPLSLSWPCLSLSLPLSLSLSLLLCLSLSPSIRRVTRLLIGG